MIPLSEFENHNHPDEDISAPFSDETIQGLSKLGEILKGISARHRMNGYSIIDRGIYNSHNELIYEKSESIKAN